MRVMLIDDEVPALDELRYFLQNYDIQMVGAFTSPVEALEHIGTLSPDVVFLDIDMPCMNGIELAVQIQTLQPHILFVFVTAYHQYSLESFKVHPLDYILKPIDPAYFERTMAYLMDHSMLNDRKPVSRATSKITCFGKFAIQNADGESVKFVTKKSRELLVYLLCNLDKPIYRDEILNLIFQNTEDEKALNNYYVSIYRLRNVLQKYKIGRTSIVIEENGIKYLADGVCDYVDFCRYINRNKVINEMVTAQGENYLSLYDGSLFSDLDAEWLNEEREWVEIQMENLAIRLAIYYTKKNKPLNAEQSLIHLLGFNPLSVPGYEMLLDLYIRTGQKDSFRSLYRIFAKHAEEDLDMKIDKLYSDYYKQSVEIM